MENIKGSIIGKWNKNKYIILEKIGEGGIGVVYKVKDKLGKIWALKMSGNANSITREYNIMKEFSNLESVPKVLEMDDYETKKEILYFFVMEFVEGKNLKDYLKNTTIQIREIVGIGLIVLKNLKELINKGYVYTDIKLDNILIDIKTNRLVFIDFGSVIDKEWGVREYTPAYNMISWGIHRNYNHIDGTIFGITMLIISMIFQKEFSPLNNKITGIIKIIKKSDINVLLKKILIKVLQFGYISIDSYEIDLKQLLLKLSIDKNRKSKKSIDIVNLIFIASIGMFLLVSFIGIK